MSGRRGFTIVEVLVAVVILVIGVLALISSSATVNRMLGEGRRVTEAVQVAQARIEYLRQQATRPDVTRCTHANFAPGSTTTGVIAESWTIDATVNPRIVRVTAAYRLARGDRTVILTTTIRC